MRLLPVGKMIEAVACGKDILVTTFHGIIYTLNNKELADTRTISHLFPTVGVRHERFPQLQAQESMLSSQEHIKRRSI